MGAGPSLLSPDDFANMKGEYEAKKAEGMTDEQLFDHMAAYFELMHPNPTKTASTDKLDTGRRSEGGTVSK